MWVATHSSGHCPKPSWLLSLWKSLSFWSWKTEAQPARGGDCLSERVLVPTGLSAKVMHLLCWHSVMAEPSEIEAGGSKERNPAVSGKTPPPAHVSSSAARNQQRMELSAPAAAQAGGAGSA